ncbi:hypothetical protein GCM10022252_75300 [Streptosporangium oxazolinicum]|uniref:Uncharacterized protein n=1 Tax=Streptosporangium oxazolinicum TaxID=909287 RepID=A0ABP8BKQ5_9ACTN
MTTTYRAGCGTFLGLRLHQASGETPCSLCLEGEADRLLVAKLVNESLPVRPSPISRAITSEQAALNREVLAAALTPARHLDAA